jgi:benzoylformate decarboxylase
VVPRNDEYAILKSFAIQEHATGVPGLELPGLDIVSIAKGYGCDAVQVRDLEAIKSEAAKAWSKDRPTVLEIPISRQVPPLF